MRARTRNFCHVVACKRRVGAQQETIDQNFRATPVARAPHFHRLELSHFHVQRRRSTKLQIAQLVSVVTIAVGSAATSESRPTASRRPSPAPHRNFRLYRVGRLFVGYARGVQSCDCRISIARRRRRQGASSHARVARARLSCETLSKDV